MECVYNILHGIETCCTYVCRFTLGDGNCHGQNLGTEVGFEIEFSLTLTSSVNLGMLFGFYKPYIPTLLNERWMHVSECAVQFKQIKCTMPDTEQMLSIHIVFPAFIQSASLMLLSCSNDGGDVSRARSHVQCDFATSYDWEWVGRGRQRLAVA